MRMESVWVDNMTYHSDEEETGVQRESRKLCIRESGSCLRNAKHLFCLRLSVLTADPTSRRLGESVRLVVVYVTTTANALSLDVRIASEDLCET